MSKPTTALVEGKHFRIQDDGCWVWIGNKNADGYGRLRYHGARWMAHRVAYRLTKGPIPYGLCVCHSCDNPACVNPDHLWLGTQAANQWDRKRKNRQALGEKNGRAKLTVRQVRDILARPKRSHTSLARLYGVSPSTIDAIFAGRHWNHIGDQE